MAGGHATLQRLERHPVPRPHDQLAIEDRPSGDICLRAESAQQRHRTVQHPVAGWACDNADHSRGRVVAEHLGNVLMARVEGQAASWPWSPPPFTSLSPTQPWLTLEWPNTESAAQ